MNEFMNRPFTAGRGQDPCGRGKALAGPEKRVRDYFIFDILHD
jgi:hypothetical protein